VRCSAVVVRAAFVHVLLGIFQPSTAILFFRRVPPRGRPRGGGSRWSYGLLNLRGHQCQIPPRIRFRDKKPTTKTKPRGPFSGRIEDFREDFFSKVKDPGGCPDFFALFSTRVSLLRVGTMEGEKGREGEGKKRNRGNGKRKEKGDLG